MGVVVFAVVVVVVVVAAAAVVVVVVVCCCCCCRCCCCRCCWWLWWLLVLLFLCFSLVWSSQRLWLLPPMSRWPSRLGPKRSAESANRQNNTHIFRCSLFVVFVVVVV